MVQKIKQSLWDSGDNIIVNTITELKALSEKSREGVILLGGHTSVGDGGGGVFVYRSNVARSNDNNGTIIDPTDTGTGNGCWVRVYSLNTGSLSWFGSNDSTVNNLLSAYGIENLIVSIPQATVGGTFQFKSAEIVNHDGVNNFNGWVRMNDVNFTENLKLNNHKITGVARAQGNTDVPNLEQVVELVQTGDYIGIVPLYADRVEGDGVTTIYITPASEQITPPPVNLISGPAFEVTVDGVKKRHVFDFTINIDEMDPDYGKLTWEAGSIPQVGEQVDIVWFAPIIVDALLGAPITASESAVSNTLEDWFGTNGKEIIVQATGTTAYKNLGDRFAENAIYFDHIAGMISGYGLYKEGMIVVVKGNTVAGDGFLGTYFIKSEANAIIDGDDYTTPGTFNVHIPTPALVAVFQRNDPHILNVEEQSLISGQTVVVFANEVHEAYIHLIGPDVDDARLVKNLHYTVAGDRKTVTLIESYPEGTLLVANWYEPELPVDLNTVEIYEDDVLKGTVGKINFVGAQVNCHLVGDTMNIYVPGVTLSGTGSVVPAIEDEGVSVVNPTLNWSWTPPGVVIDTLTVTAEPGVDIPVLTTDLTVVVPYTYTTDKTFTIAGTSVFGAFNISVVLPFNKKIFWGRNANTTLSGAEVLALSSLMDITQEQEFNFAAGSGYLWIVYPQSMGLATRWDNLNALGDIILEEPVQELIAFDPGTGVTSNYYVQRSAYQLAGAIDVMVSV